MQSFGFHNFDMVKDKDFSMLISLNTGEDESVKYRIVLEGFAVASNFFF